MKRRGEATEWVCVCVVGVRRYTKCTDDLGDLGMCSHLRKDLDKCMMKWVSGWFAAHERQEGLTKAFVDFGRLVRRRMTMKMKMANGD